MSLFVGETPVKAASREATGSFVDQDGERFYRIADFDSMQPFLMSLVSDSDHWLFISSTGSLTAGRKDPDHALFPYYTDDRIHDGADETGSETLLRVSRGGRASLWEPFSERYQGLYSVRRDLYKSVYGNRIRFEETNADLGLRFSYEWASSERFGFVRRARLTNLGADAVVVELLDGIQNVLPSGVERRFQLEYSTLADGYKRTELVPGTPVALFRLSSIPVDKAEPSEALRVNLAWSLGLESAQILLSASQLPAFRAGAQIGGESDVRGRRGAYFLHATLRLETRAAKDWLVIAELDQDAAGVHALLARVGRGEGLGEEVLAEVAQGTRNLVRIVASADGLQVTEDERSCWRHFSNTLFNAMRGGIPDDGYRISRLDLVAFLRKSNAELAKKHAAFLDGLPAAFLRGELMEAVAKQQDDHLERLASEYLPFTFSRRHGDPSRPWNVFAIQVKDEHGNKILNYQGNWRDIFQNWEALACSYPRFVLGMIFKFLDSSTADGFNPYRVLREGYEWEAVEPDDPWSFIGYWGDHQVIYLLKLLEVARRYQPGSLASLLGRRVFTYADVPYRLKSYQAMLANPRSTIDFDRGAHERALERAKKLGADGKALQASGELTRASLVEKLLVVALSKLSSFIPEGGIWMNTQRPEWNDANNALVGYGVSMVTLYYLRRYLAFCQAELARVPGGKAEVAEELAEHFTEIARALTANLHQLEGRYSDVDRKRVLDTLGRSGDAYRQKIYARGFSGAMRSLGAAELSAFCSVALRHLDHSIRANRRSDGLYHAYNLMKVKGEGIEIRHLYEMLEGQVAVLSSGALETAEALELLTALRGSALYRADQASYLLYPDRALPRFLEKNTLPKAALEGSALLGAMLKAGDPRIVSRDLDGGVHFNASFRNAELLGRALDALAGSELGALAMQEKASLLELYEQVFDHQSFTGRSGTFYKYEGLGCIYWHMVSKLLLAADEVLQRALATGAGTATVAALRAEYHAIREGIGVHKSPALYGAVPTDPYSHTPSFAGVQQPGMTGQVKEDFITRFSELGLQVHDGKVRFNPALVVPGEFLSERRPFTYVDLSGRTQSLELPAGSLGFTLCQVPVVLHRSGPARIVLTASDGSTRTVDGLELDAETSAALFDRRGTLSCLTVFASVQPK
ncbi:MAG TPA: hypothetical protein VMX54_22430 [Vicinamibacteria bacterium]|nr:hypothetical protein [Vicinamibacteria bacterium]